MVKRTTVELAKHEELVEANVNVTSHNSLVKESKHNINQTVGTDKICRTIRSAGIAVCVCLMWNSVLLFAIFSKLS